mmetsp:Transcript_78324/g.242847  ORF Transcript_78324/g.242847 Transcript_78324/m.242847 type:complete len:456 (+) Transcript_78324:74-1441(+)
MGDDWDPFADPAENAAEVAAVVEKPDGIRVDASSAEPDLDLLQPWELEGQDRIAPGKGAKPNGVLARKLGLPQVADLEQELAVLSAPLAASEIPASIGPIKPPPKLTKEQAIALEDMLIAAYKTEEFQRKLHEAWNNAGGDPRLQGKARQEVCLPVQVPILVQFGFEASRRGVTQSVNAFGPLNGEPEIVERNNALAWLVNPAMQLGVLQASGRRLTPCEELVDKAMEGDAGAVRYILEHGGDPNTVVLREERLKGSDGCCSCTITSEEYTPLVAACMFQHLEIAGMLLEHGATDVNIVCAGVNQEFGPYKHFTALDIVRRCMKDSPVVGWLEAMGAKTSGELPEPPWPRPKSDGTPEPPPKAKPPPMPEARAPEREAKVPAADSSSGEGAEKATGEIAELMRGHRCDAPADRSRLFRQLLLEWHPDKRPEEERELSTAVCRWLVGPAKCFVGGA